MSSLNLPPTSWGHENTQSFHCAFSQIALSILCVALHFHVCALLSVSMASVVCAYDAIRESGRFCALAYSIFIALPLMAQLPWLCCYSTLWHSQGMPFFQPWNTQKRTSDQNTSHQTPDVTQVCFMFCSDGIFVLLVRSMMANEQFNNFDFHDCCCARHEKVQEHINSLTEPRSVQTLPFVCFWTMCFSILSLSMSQTQPVAF